MYNDWFLYHLDLPLYTKMCFPLLSFFTSRTGHRNHPIKGIKVVICRKKGVVLIRHQAREKERTLCWADFKFSNGEVLQFSHADFWNQSISDKPAETHDCRRRGGRESSPRRSLHASLQET